MRVVEAMIGVRELLGDFVAERGVDGLVGIIGTMRADIDSEIVNILRGIMEAVDGGEMVLLDAGIVDALETLLGTDDPELAAKCEAFQTLYDGTRGE
jgi:hypothetical protein